MNHLANEQSPYLRQHRHNPVEWYPWGEQAFEKANREDKPIFLSIGYSTCYWCHVMEKDSFEHEQVASVLAKYFISIKVDREERPDIDQIYMDTVVALTGHGGWPMSVFLTPEKKPFWGGTFFNQDQFIKIVTTIGEAWINDRASILENSEKITDFLKAKSEINEKGSLDETILIRALGDLEHSFDKNYGGFGSAPKFPPSQQIRLLFRLGGKAPTLMATKTLDAMAKGGIYDHVEGGFSRYSVDEKWLVPHFEKMLYDNSLLCIAYLEGYQITKNNIFKEVAEGILNYLLERMESAEGGFFSAEDAGEVGKEGEFYVWSYSELEDVLGEGFKRFENIFELPKDGNFEHGKIVLSAKAWDREKISDLLNTLRKKRDERTRPHRDEKILTSWNGLALTAFSKGFQVLGEDKLLQGALRCAHFIEKNLLKDRFLAHSYCLGSSSIEGNLEDYAFLIEGLLTLYESTFDTHWLSLARMLQKSQDEHFLDENGGYFFASINAKDLIVRRKEYIDGATPSGNGVSFENLYRLHLLFPDVKEYRDRYQALLEEISGSVQKYPTAFCRFLQTFKWTLEGGKEVGIVGNAKEFLQIMYKEFTPFKVIGVPGENGPTFTSHLGSASQGVYVCENGGCLPKLDSPEELLDIIGSRLEAVS